MRFFRKKSKEEKIKEMERILVEQIKKLARKGTIDDKLLNFVKDIENTKHKNIFWVTILSRKDLTSDQYYNICRVMNEQVATDQSLLLKARTKFLNIADEDQLYEILRYEGDEFQKMAWDEIRRKIRLLLFSEKKARNIIMKIFENVPDYRVKSLETMEILPSLEINFEYLLRLPFMRTEPEFTARIEKLRKEKFNKKRRNPNVKLLDRVKNATQKMIEFKKG